MESAAHELLYPRSAGFGTGVQLNVSFDSGSQGLTTWRRKNLEDELQLYAAELREARATAGSLQKELRAFQKENTWLKRQLEIQSDRDELLRDIRDRVSEGDACSIDGQRKGRLCGAVCAILGRS